MPLGPESDSEYDHPRVDLQVFNRWLASSRLRAAGAVAVFALVLEYLGVGELRAIPVRPCGVAQD